MAPHERPEAASLLKRVCGHPEELFFLCEHPAEDREWQPRQQPALTTTTMVHTPHTTNGRNAESEARRAVFVVGPHHVPEALCLHAAYAYKA
jgi:hypothetical protein